MGVLSHWDPYRAGIANARDFLSGLAIAFAIRSLDPVVKITKEARVQLGLAVGMRCYFVIKANAVNPLWES